MNLKIYKQPQPKELYAIGADVALGLASGDNSTIAVYNLSYEMVASWTGHIAPDTFGLKLCAIGEFYNHAMLVVEVNNHGLTTITKIKEKVYPNIYKRKKETETKDRYLEVLGWETTFKSKMKMLDDFCALYRDNNIIINDHELLREMTTIMIEEDGQVELNGKDRLVASCLAVQGIKEMQNRKLQEKPVLNETQKRLNELYKVRRDDY